MKTINYLTLILLTSTIVVFAPDETIEKPPIKSSETIESKELQSSRAKASLIEEREAQATLDKNRTTEETKQKKQQQEQEPINQYPFQESPNMKAQKKKTLNSKN